MTVQFDPAPVRPRRPVSDRLVALATVLLAALVVVAVAKPWQGQPAVVPVPPPQPPVARGPTASPVPTVAPDQAPATLPAVVQAAAVTRSLDWAILGRLVTRHEAPGVEAIVQVAKGARARRGDILPSMGGVAAHKEVWAPIPAAALSPDASSAASLTAAPRVRLRIGAAAVIAIGVTMPAARRPLDIRFWHLPDGGRPPERVAVLDTPASDVDGIRFFWAPGGTSANPGWAPGTYVAELLTLSAIERTVFVIPGMPGAALPAVQPQPTPRPSRADLSLLTRNLPPGRVFTLDAVPSAIPWPSVATGAGDERAAWLASLRAASNDTVAMATVFQPIGIGLRLPTEATLRSARLVRLGPTIENLASVAIGSGAALPRAPEAAVPQVLPGVVLFESAVGREWPAGIYRVDATWVIGTNVQGQVVRRASWILDLARYERAPS